MPVTYTGLDNFRLGKSLPSSSEVSKQVQGPGGGKMVCEAMLGGSNINSTIDAGGRLLPHGTQSTSTLSNVLGPPRQARLDYMTVCLSDSIILQVYSKPLSERYTGISGYANPAAGSYTAHSALQDNNNFVGLFFFGGSRHLQRVLHHCRSIITLLSPHHEALKPAKPSKDLAYPIKRHLKPAGSHCVTCQTLM